MPIQPTYPGVYIEEVPSGVRPITGVSTSVTAFVGRTRRGPQNDPIRLSSFGDFTRRFGGHWAETSLSYAIDDFFANGGSEAVVVRLYEPNGNVDGRSTIAVDSLNLVAASPGSWGDKLSVRVEYSEDREATKEFASRYGITENDLFDLRIEDGGTGAKEVIRNVGIAGGDALPRRVDRVLEAESNLVRIALQNDGTPDLPNAIPADDSSATGQNGDDGVELTPQRYEGDKDQKTGIYALLKTDIFNILCLPPDVRDQDTPTTVWEEAAKLCYERRAFLLIDPPGPWDANPDDAVSRARDGQRGTPIISLANARNAALFFPRIRKPDPMRGNQIETFAPCGAIAGVMARTDKNRGVWKAAAGTEASIAGVQELTVKLTDDDNGVLNPLAINCLRTFPVVGRVVWGARTLRGADQLADDYKYVPVRRLALFIEESLYRGTQWVVFEPNDEPLWAQIRMNVGAFMQRLFQQGAFQGSSPKDAYFVKCDSETTTQADINLGIVNILVGFAPLLPAEFVILQIQQIRNAN